jgi:hypothetical protein
MDEKVRREQEVQKHKEWRMSLKAKYTLGSFEEAIFNKFDKVCISSCVFVCSRFRVDKIWRNWPRHFSSFTQHPHPPILALRSCLLAVFGCGHVSFVCAG